MTYSHANLTAGNITDLDIVTDANLGEPLRDLEINPASRVEAGQGGEYLAKAHQVAEPLRVDTQRALKGRAKGHRLSRASSTAICAFRDRLRAFSTSS